MYQIPSSSPLRDAAHARMQRDYIHARQAEGWRLLGAEMPYGNGNGFADVVLFKDEAGDGGRRWLVSELKPTLQNVGEAIRQVRRASGLFPRSYPELLGPDGAPNCRFPLVILASEENWRRCVLFSALLAGVDLEFFHPDRAVQTTVSSKFEIECAILEAAKAPTRSTYAEAAGETVRPPSCGTWTRAACRSDRHNARLALPARAGKDARRP